MCGHVWQNMSGFELWESTCNSCASIFSTNQKMNPSPFPLRQIQERIVNVHNNRLLSCFPTGYWWKTLRDCLTHRISILRRRALPCTLVQSRLCGWSYLIYFLIRKLSYSPSSEPSRTVLFFEVMYTTDARQRCKSNSPPWAAPFIPPWPDCPGVS